MLEVGVGTGLIAKALCASGFRVTGVDISLAMLGRARERLGPGAPIVAADAGRMPFAEVSFDQAFSVWVLHVVGDRAAALGEVARILRAGGRYLVVPGFSPEPGDPIGRAILDMQLRADPEGRRRDDPEHLRALAPAAGLRVAEVRPLGPHDYDESPAEAIRKIETRSYSVLWRLDDDRYGAATEPALAALRAMPDPEVRLARRSIGSLVVLEKGA